MQRVYTILEIPGFCGRWQDVPAASIDVRPWEAGGPLPPAEAKVVFAGDRFLVQLKSWEQNLAVATHTHNGVVWLDSCIEFFLNPAPDRDHRYLNFEVNAEGVMLLGLGDGRHDRELLDFDPAMFEIRADVPALGAAAWQKPFYSMEFAIPVAFLESIYGPLALGAGSLMAGNFQKCGEHTANPHYGCWNPIGSAQPDFHRPEFFGILKINH